MWICSTGAGEKSHAVNDYTVAKCVLDAKSVSARSS